MGGCEICAWRTVGGGNEGRNMSFVAFLGLV